MSPPASSDGPGSAFAALSPPSGLLGILDRVLRAGVWIVRRPFIVPQWAWATATAVLIGACIGAIAHGANIPALILAAAAMLTSLVWAQWWLLGRGDDPVVVLSPYAAQTLGGHEASGTQLQSLKRFLTTDEYVLDAGGVIVRQVAVPVNAGDARRLLTLRRVVLVVRGETAAGADAAYFRGEAHFRADGPTIMLNRYELSVYGDSPKISWLRRLVTGDRVASVPHEEGDLDMRRFAAASLQIKHFHQITKVLLILLSELAVKQPARLRVRGTLVLPNPSDNDLDEELQTRALLLEVETRRDEDPRAVLEDLEQQIERDGIGGAGAALWLLTQWFAGEVEKWTTRDETFAAAQRWSSRFPDDPLLLANLAGTEMRSGELDTARATLARAQANGLGLAEHERFLGNIAWAAHDPTTALDHYQQAASTPAALAWQIGDCYAALGDRRRALRSYRRSLRADSFRVPAAEHARQLAGWLQPLPTFPGGSRQAVWRILHRSPRLASPALQAWRRTRPDDPYLASWMARHALLRGDMRRADQWSLYATRFAGTNRLIANVDQLVVMVLTDHPDAKDWATHAAEHMAWLESKGVPARTDVKQVVSDLFARLGYLRNQPQRDTVIDMVFDATGIVVAVTPNG